MNIFEAAKAKLKDATKRLHVASRMRILDEVAEAIAEGAQLDALGSDGVTALHFAAEHRLKEMAESLLAAGANPNARDKQGSTPLHSAMLFCSYSAEKDASFIHLLSGAGVDPNAVDSRGETALARNSERHNWDYFAALIQLGADVNLPDLKGLTPLMKYAKSNHATGIADLIGAGADLSAMDEAHRSALSHYCEGLAANHSHWRSVDDIALAVSSLICPGVVGACDTQGKTPLDYLTQSPGGVVPQRVKDLLISKAIEEERADLADISAKAAPSPGARPPLRM